MTGFRVTFPNGTIQDYPGSTLSTEGFPVGTHVGPMPCQDGPTTAISNPIELHEEDGTDEGWEDHPERIWKWPGGGSFAGSTCYPDDHEDLDTDGLVPYVRADLFDALAAERDALRAMPAEAVDDCTDGDGKPHLNSTLAWVWDAQELLAKTEPQ